MDVLQAGAVGGVEVVVGTQSDCGGLVVGGVGEAEGAVSSNSELIRKSKSRY